LKINKEFNIDMIRQFCQMTKAQLKLVKIIDSEINFAQGVGINSSVYNWRRID